MAFSTVWLQTGSKKAWGIIRDRLGVPRKLPYLEWADLLAPITAAGICETSSYGMGQPFGCFFTTPRVCQTKAGSGRRLLRMPRIASP
jgi:hypothetical protein